MGKTYCCSDIHAHLDVFEKALEILGPEDKLFIIGDVIDKGPDGVKVLQKIIENEKCELIIGNHDLMMLEFLNSAKEFDDPEEFERFSKYSRIGDVWLTMNDGEKTYNDFKSLSQEEQEKIFNYLKGTYVLRKLNINRNDFVLVHAVAINQGEEEVKTAELLENGHYNWMSEYVWGRYDVPVEDTVVITGHTTVQHYGVSEAFTFEYEDGVVIDIDCGLAARKKSYGSKLCLMCLDDMSFQYFEPEVY